MVSPFNTKRFAALALSGLLASLIGLGISVSAPQAAASPLDGEPPAAKETAPPRMVLTQMVHDAGQVERGEMITHQFTFRNTGGSDLVILSTKAG